MVFEKLKEILVSNFDLDDSEVVPEASLSMDLDMDELDFWDIVMDIEEVFEIEFTAEFDYRKVTVGDIIKFIEENI